MIFSEPNLSDVEELISGALGQYNSANGHVVWRCNQCGKENNHKRIMRSHVETHFPGVFEQTCTICGRVSKNKDSMRGQMRNYHKDNSLDPNHYYLEMS